MNIPGLSMDGHSYSGTREYTWGYSDMSGGGGVSVDIPGLSMAGHSYSGIHGGGDSGYRIAGNFREVQIFAIFANHD